MTQILLVEQKQKRILYCAIEEKLMKQEAKRMNQSRKQDISLLDRKVVSLKPKQLYEGIR